MAGDATLASLQQGPFDLLVKRSPLADANLSQAALRWGDYVTKVGIFPVSPTLAATIDHRPDTSTDSDAFRTAIMSHVRGNAAELDLRVQSYIGTERMPVDDGPVQWLEEASYAPSRTSHAPCPGIACAAAARNLRFSQTSCSAFGVWPTLVCLLLARSVALSACPLRVQRMDVPIDKE